MKPAVYQEALDAFANPFHEFSIEKIDNGLINCSFKVTSRLNGVSFLLQKINTKVFPEPAYVQSNYGKLWKFLQAEQLPLYIPQPRYFPDDSSLYVDSHDNYWRVFEYVMGSQTFTIAESADQARAAAKAFASFTAAFEDFDLALLNITIQDFHNLSARYAQLQQSIHSGHLERLVKAANLIEELKKRERYAHFYDVITDSDAFKKRVIHHDAKLSNILFDTDTRNVICPVDFDTVMPGYFYSDLGDMIRTMAACRDENSIALEEQCIRKDFYEAIVSGYMSVMESHLSDAEKKYIHFSGLMMTYMQALRFLTDYLSGDIYYRTDYREQNFDRAQNQLALLKQLEAFLEENYRFKI